jgi:choline dehydrogenase
LARHIIDESFPGRQIQSDGELSHVARQYSVTIYHPTSTCKLGHDEAADLIR